MKQIKHTYTCDICNMQVVEANIDSFLFGLYLSNASSTQNKALKQVASEAADIHICINCVDGIKAIKY